jgi:hypothetical protein
MTLALKGLLTTVGLDPTALFSALVLVPALALCLGWFVLSVYWSAS